MRKMLLPTLTVSIVLAATMNTAVAQTSDPTPGTLFQRGYMTATAGAATTGMGHTAMVGTEFVERITDAVQAYAALSYHDDVLRQEDADTLARMGAARSVLTGTAYDLRARDRGVAFTMGAKVALPTGGPARPYVGAGGGYLNIHRTIREAHMGDVTQAFMTEVGAVGGAIDPTKTSTNRPLAEALAGAEVGFGRGVVDVSYRYAGCSGPAPPSRCRNCRRESGCGGDGTASSLSRGVTYPRASPFETLRVIRLPEGCGTHEQTNRSSCGVTAIACGGGSSSPTSPSTAPTTAQIPRASLQLSGPASWDACHTGNCVFNASIQNVGAGLWDRHRRRGAVL